MHADSPIEIAGVTDQLSYFMLRIRRSADGSTILGGMIERLGTGEKRSFDSCEELIDLISRSPALQPTIRPSVESRNLAGEATDP
jgi:hypothetical protein